MWRKPDPETMKNKPATESLERSPERPPAVDLFGGAENAFGPTGAEIRAELKESTLDKFKSLVEVREVEDSHTGKTVTRGYIQPDGREIVRQIGASMEGDEHWHDPNYRRDKIRAWLRPVEQYLPEDVRTETIEAAVGAMNRSFGAHKRYNDSLSQVLSASPEEVRALGLTSEQASAISDPVKREKLAQELKVIREQPQSLVEVEVERAKRIKDNMMAKVKDWREQRRERAEQKARTQAAVEEIYRTHRKNMYTLKQRLIFTAVGVAMAVTTISAILPPSNEASFYRPQSVAAMEMEKPSVDWEAQMERLSAAELRELWEEAVENGTAFEEVSIINSDGTESVAPVATELELQDVIRAGQMPDPAKNELQYMQLKGDKADYLIQHHFYGTSAKVYEYSHNGNVKYIRVGNFLFEPTESREVVREQGPGTASEMASERGSGAEDEVTIVRQRCRNQTEAEARLGKLGVRMDNSDRVQIDGYKLVGVLNN